MGVSGSGSQRRPLAAAMLAGIAAATAIANSSPTALPFSLIPTGWSIYLLAFSAVVAGYLLYTAQCHSKSINATLKATLKALAAVVLVLSLDIPLGRLSYNNYELAKLRDLKAKMPQIVANTLIRRHDTNNDNVLSGSELLGFEGFGDNKDGKDGATVGAEALIDFSKTERARACKRNKNGDDDDVYCTTYCDEVYSAAELRQESLHRVRRQNPIAGFYSEVFDSRRGVDQVPPLTRIQQRPQTRIQQRDPTLTTTTQQLDIASHTTHETISYY